MISVLRDISERGRELEQVLNQYITFVKPAFEEFCLPVRNFETFLSRVLGFISRYFLLIDALENKTDLV